VGERSRWGCPPLSEVEFIEVGERVAYWMAHQGSLWRRWAQEARSGA
jgi:hypothetical protein